MKKCNTSSTGAGTSSWQGRKLCEAMTMHLEGKDVVEGRETRIHRRGWQRDKAKAAPDQMPRKVWELGLHLGGGAAAMAPPSTSRDTLGRRKTSRRRVPSSLRKAGMASACGPPERPGKGMAKAEAKPVGKVAGWNDIGSK